MQADAAEQAVRDIEATVEVLALTADYGEGTRQHECEVEALAAISYRIDEQSTVISTTDTAAVARALGSAAKSPDPFLSVAARQSGPAVAGRIERTFAELMSGMQND